jgi:hypothetical protein
MRLPGPLVACCSLVERVRKGTTHYYGGAAIARRAVT